MPTELVFVVDGIKGIGKQDNVPVVEKKKGVIERWKNHLVDLPRDDRQRSIAELEEKAREERKKEIKGCKK